MVARLVLLFSSLYTIAITWLSLVQLGKISFGGFNPTDKMLHAGAYLFLVLLWKSYFICKEEESVTAYQKNLYIVGIMCLLFGMLMEFFQGFFTNYRDPDWWDILANSLGVFIGIIFFLTFSGRIRRIRKTYL